MTNNPKEELKNDMPKEIWIRESNSLSTDFWGTEKGTNHPKEVKYVRADTIQIPDGFVLVPFQPDAKMYEAGANKFYEMNEQHELSTMQEMGAIYEAMINAHLEDEG